MVKTLHVATFYSLTMQLSADPTQLCSFQSLPQSLHLRSIADVSTYGFRIHTHSHTARCFTFYEQQSGPPETDGEADIQRPYIMPVFHWDEKDLSWVQDAFLEITQFKLWIIRQVWIFHIHLAGVV